MMIVMKTEKMARKFKKIYKQHNLDPFYLFYDTVIDPKH